MYPKSQLGSLKYQLTGMSFAILTVGYFKRFTYNHVRLTLVLMTFMYDVNDLPSVLAFFI